MYIVAMRLREPAICLRTNDFSETSQVVHFFTRSSGSVRLLAKGSKRPKSKTGGAIDLLGEGDLVFIPSSSGALGTLVEFTETVSHSPLRKNARRLNIALYMIELVGEMLAENDPHPELFDLLHNALARLGQEDAPMPAVLAYFQWRALKHIGLLGELKACVSCGIALAESQQAAAFSSRQGGMLCRRCAAAAPEKLQLTPEAIKGMVILAAAEAGKKVSFEHAEAMAVNRVLAYHAANQIGKPLKTAKLVLG